MSTISGSCGPSQSQQLFDKGLEQAELEQQTQKVQQGRQQEAQQQQQVNGTERTQQQLNLAENSKGGRFNDYA